MGLEDLLMSTIQEKAHDFLAQKRIAVAGVSRHGDQPANLIYRKLRDAGHEVFATNPKTETAEGATCYPDLTSIPGGVDAVVVATPPDAAESIVRQCSELGISRVWMHRSFGRGSVSETAVETCREHGISVIPGGCPMMFEEPVDFGHKCIRWMLGVTGVPFHAQWRASGKLVAVGLAAAFPVSPLASLVPVSSVVLPPTVVPGTYSGGQSRAVRGG